MADVARADVAIGGSDHSGSQEDNVRRDVVGAR
jgi:hypothetical protein